MGLDMYLRAKRYLWNNEQDQPIAKAVAEAIGLPEEEVKEVSIMAAQWRKANAIHNWFVENVQDGEDNCAAYCLDIEILNELRDVCVRLLASKNPKDAEELLPCTDGCFFGSQAYDGWYWEDLAYTVEAIDKCNELGAGWEFEYQASW